MRTILRILLVLLVVILILGLAGFGVGYATVRRAWPQINGTLHVPGLRAPVTVIRDRWGIPHIYASNLHDLLFAQGYVHAQDRFWQMEFWRRLGSGRLAEILGPSALPTDRFVRTIGWHRAAAQDWEQLDPETRTALEAYAAGVNAYISTHQGRLGLEFTLLGLTGKKFDPEPWTPVHTITWGKVMAWDLGGNMSYELLRAGIIARLGTGAVPDLMPAPPPDRPVIVPHPLTQATLQSIPEAIFTAHFLGEGEGLGSNNWVVAGSRTETGMPLLANDPHLGLQMPSIWYEIGLHCEPKGPDCPINAVGASFAGSPGVIIGHNDRIAWGVTNVNPDVQDLFIEKVNPENPNQYEYQGRWEDMQIVREEIRVAGREEPVVVLARITRHGPIINDIVGGEEEDWSFGWQPLALSWTALQPGTLMRSILLLDKAQNWEDFREALSYWDVPSQNFVYADVEGNIGYQTPGRIPIRKNGDGSVPVPGWTGEYEWVDSIPFDDLPRAFNPPEGYIVTANNAVVGPDYPYLLTVDWSDRTGQRAQRITELIEELTPISVEDMQQIQGDNLPVWTREVLPYVTAALADYHDPRPLELLRNWDGRATRDSAAAAIFEAFRLHLVERTFRDDLGESLLRQAKSSVLYALESIVKDSQSPWFDDRQTPQRETRDEIFRLALEDAVAELTEQLGPNMEKWRWGDLHTATFKNQALGQSGIAWIERIFNRGPVATDGTAGAVNNTGYNLNAPYTVRSGPSYRQIVDVEDWSRSLSMHPTGQSGHPFHRHYDDMIDPWRNIQYHPMLWSRTEVEAQAEGILLLVP
ncbi:MAG: penicillin acylase family protein [Anaerolineae bacterium]